MSEQVEVEVLFRNSFSWVFQRTDRGNPSISIQGDSLALLRMRVRRALEALEPGMLDEDSELDLEMAADTLDGMWMIYKQYGWVDEPRTSKRQDAT
ncbi:hypothetical protein HNQ07_000272 [Deinococcus metalli]|uniref:Uncharacterized protein n=1 Tax=Deinococcus metalli TaxID=1141878 RepID=A0A7W8KD27_9DEIO|nr:hypothetical protein [Deinococcus metalli]MBB5374828.1 hypothetical protein [Deinococcus metalli]